MAANGDEPCARRADDVEFETLGLLDGLDSAARRERAELIAWLIEEGFSLEHIRASVAAPLMLPAYRVLGDDGQLVSARDICELTGMNLEVVQRLHRAVGLPRIDDPDARVLPRADAESIRHAKLFLDLGYAPQDAVAVLRVLVESLGHAAAMMREAALKTLLHPGASEIELAQASERLAVRAAPMIGPMMDDLLRLELRHSFEIEAVTAAERAAGTLPGRARSASRSLTWRGSPNSARRCRQKIWNGWPAGSPNSHTMSRAHPSGS